MMTDGAAEDVKARKRERDRLAAAARRKEKGARPHNESMAAQARAAGMKPDTFRAQRRHEKSIAKSSPVVERATDETAIGDAELAVADIYQLMERRHCLTIGKAFDSADWERRRRAVEQLRSNMAAGNAGIVMIAGEGADNAQQRCKGRS